jgi:hypothetical protein
MNTETIPVPGGYANDRTINIRMVESILHQIFSLTSEERALLEQRLSDELPEYPELTSDELIQMSAQGGAFDFWRDEPEIYSIEDGEPIEW